MIMDVRLAQKDNGALQVLPVVQIVQKDNTEEPVILDVKLAQPGHILLPQELRMLARARNASQDIGVKQELAVVHCAEPDIMVQMMGIKQLVIVMLHVLWVIIVLEE